MSDERGEEGGRLPQTVYGTGRHPLARPTDLAKHEVNRLGRQRLHGDWHGRAGGRAGQVVVAPRAQVVAVGAVRGAVGHEQQEARLAAPAQARGALERRQDVLLRGQEAGLERARCSEAVAASHPPNQGLSGGQGSRWGWGGRQGGTWARARRCWATNTPTRTSHQPRCPKPAPRPRRRLPLARSSPAAHGRGPYIYM
jgi:hypothetical protein